MKLSGLIILFIFFVTISGFSQTGTCSKSTEGKDFWIGFMECRNFEPGHYVDITVTSVYECNYAVYIGKSQVPYTAGIALPNIPKRITIDWHQVEVIGSESIQEKAIHLVSDNPLNVYALSWASNSADVAVIYPTESLGNEYYAMCYDPHISSLWPNGDAQGKNSEFLIVASEDNTTVEITPSKITDKLKPANVAFSITLNKGELYQVQSENLLNTGGVQGQGDLTGSYITSNKPIAVFSGSYATTVPVTSNDAWDHLYEQLPPVQTWGRKFIAVPLLSRLKDTYRILAAENRTTIRIGNKSPILINKGNFYEFMLNSDEASWIESDKPVLLAQYSNSNNVDRPPGVTSNNWDGDPFMIIVSPVNQTREKVAFVAYESSHIKRYFINVVVKDETSGKINLDGIPVIFHSLSGTGYSYAQVEITKGKHFIESLEPGKGFIAYVYAFGGYESYGYGVGFNLDIVLDLGGNINSTGKLLVRCDGDPPLTLNAGNAFDKYLWNTGDTTSVIQVTKAGWYKVKVSINNGCNLTDSVEVRDSKPLVFLGRDTLICPNSSILLDAGSHDQFTSYLWSTSKTDQMITVSAPGTYSVVATNLFGCIARDTIKISTASQPKIDLSKLDTVMCGEYTTTLDVSADKTVTWLFESTNPKIKIKDLTASVSPADLGSYPVTLTAKDEFSCTATAAFNLGFYLIPVLNLGRDTTICNPENIRLNAGTQYTGYLWSTKETTPAISVQTSGIYSVSITDKNGCKTSDTIRIISTDKPKLDLSKLDTLICGKYTTTLNISASKPVTYSLQSDPRVKFSGLTATVLPTDFGTYPVTITAKDASACATTTSFNLGFYRTPSVSLTGNTKMCSGYNLNVGYVGDADTVISKFKWIYNGKVIADSTGLNSLSVPLGINLSQRDLSLTVTQDGCSNTYTQKDIRVIPNLDLHIVKNPGCAPFNAEFIAENTEVVVYDWDFGDGTPVERKDQHPFHTYQSDGFYDVKLKVTTIVPNGEGCVNEVEIDSLVHVAPIPTAGFTPFPAECLEKGDHSISYKGTGDSFDRYIWDLSKFDNSEIIRNPGETQGPFIFNLKNKPQSTIGIRVISQYGCLSDNATVLVKRVPDFSVRASSNAGCTPFEPLFKVTAGDPVDKSGYSWDFGDGAGGTGDSIKHIYEVPDHRYDIIITALSSVTGCTDTIYRPSFIWTYPIPTSGFTPLPVECLEKGDHYVSYSGTGDALDRYIWDLSKFDNSEIIRNPGETQGPFIFNLKTKPQATIGLRVISKYGCKSENAAILVKRVPDFSVRASSNAGCTPFEPLFTGTTADPVDKVHYSWDFGDGATGSGDHVKHVYEVPGNKYDIILTALSSVTGCSDTLFRRDYIWAYPRPHAAFSMDNRIVYNDKPTVNFSNQSSGEKEYLWNFGDGENSDLKNPSHYYKVTGYRTVLLEVFNEYMCSDTVTHRLLVAFDRVFPPTGFSPNSPNIVDREFKLYSEGILTEGYHLTIISRWNDIIFEARDEIKGWDGHMKNGSLAPAGVYVWVLNFTDSLHRRHRQSGAVTLVY